MNSDLNSSQPSFTHSWRYRVGLVLIILGHLLLLGAILTPIFGFTSKKSLVFVGAFAIVGEVLCAISIVFLGKDGFKAIVDKVLRFASDFFIGPVGRVRHYIGIFLVFLNFFTNITIGLLVYLLTLYSSSAMPTPVIWGMEWHQQNTFVLSLLIIGELAFLIGIYVLGANWWQQLRLLILWEGVNKS